MKTTQYTWNNAGWVSTDDKEVDAGLCLIFGSRPEIENNLVAIAQMQKKYPNSEVITVSTAGNILDEQLLDTTIIATCISFEKTRLKSQCFDLGLEDDEKLGQKIATQFDANELAYVLLFSTVGINVENVLKGINAVFKGRVPVSGGVAGDDTRFEKTLVGSGTNISSSQIVALGFYGKNLVVSHGSKGGWNTFGPIRKVTRCAGNVLYEIDDKPALDLYKKYLGDKAAELPASGLLFPFCIIDGATQEPVVRGIQNINEADQSIILYGDVMQGQDIQLMRANFDNLISGAGDSAKEALLHHAQQPELALLISCVARRLVLGQLTEEELLESKAVIGSQATICGFYSYSEISPLVGDNACHLHNQTMTITTFSEKISS